MKSSASFALVHREIEGRLGDRIPSALSPRPRTIRERLPSDVPPLDALLDSGLPVGAISEMVGMAGSGRTTAAVTFVSATARAGKVVAWIDVADTFDPMSAAINGVALERLLWMRCSTASPSAATAADMRPMFTAPAAEKTPAPVRGGGSPHPRSEINGMPEAVRAMLSAHGGLQHHQARRERRMIGTPGAPNRPLDASPYREEQRPTDRQPSRSEKRHRSEAGAISDAAIPCCSEPLPHRRKVEEPKQHPRTIAVSPATPQSRPQHKPSWTALEHAMRATDLLLQAGGFGLIVLDLGDTPAEMAWRIPLATWFRYRAGCERSRTSLLLLTQHPCARSSAELVVRLHPASIEAQGKVLTGFSFHAEIERQRFATQQSNVISIRKPPQSEKAGQWKGRASWAV